LVWLHSGHFCTRSIESPAVDGLARLLANQIPAIIVSVDYRLAPDFPYPAPLDDCFSALNWAVTNATFLGSSPDLVSIGGDGAGGNLAAAVALMARDKGLPLDAKLLTQLLVTPPLDLTDEPNGENYNSRNVNKNGYMLPLSQFAWFVNQYAKKDKTDSYLSPLLCPNLANLPTTLMISATHDLFCSENKAYANRLKESEVRVIYTQYSNSGNSFFGSGLDESDEAVMELVLFLHQEIANKIKSSK